MDDDTLRDEDIATDDDEGLLGLGDDDAGDLDTDADDADADADDAD